MSLYAKGVLLKKSCQKKIWMKKIYYPTVFTKLLNIQVVCSHSSKIINIHYKMYSCMVGGQVGKSGTGFLHYEEMWKSIGDDCRLMPV